MKELSVEEKAKAYDELMKKLNEARNDDRKGYTFISIIDNICPELVESEDEKIRKELIRMVKEDWPGRKDITAWLEKKGEQKLDDKVELSTFRNKLLELFLKFRRSCKEQIPTNEEILEYVNAHIQELIGTMQKSADKVEPKFKVGQTIIYKGTENIAPTKMTISDIAKGQYWDDNCCIVPISDQDNWELVEQKPAWSEEDEKLVKNLISTLSNLYARNLIEKETKEKYTNLLKSIKDRVRPMQEWNDVDKDILFRIINDLKFLRDTISKDPKYAVNIINTEREITWLKSLRPQNIWKPSDEQMTQLFLVANQNIGNILGNKLMSLYNDLTKLTK